MLNNKKTITTLTIGASILGFARSGPASYAACQSACAAAAGIATLMSAGVCSAACVAAYATCQSGCAAAAFAPCP